MPKTIEIPAYGAIPGGQMLVSGPARPRHEYDRAAGAYTDRPLQGPSGLPVWRYSATMILAARGEGPFAIDVDVESPGAPPVLEAAVVPIPRSAILHISAAGPYALKLRMSDIEVADLQAHPIGEADD